MLLNEIDSPKVTLRCLEGDSLARLPFQTVKANAVLRSGSTVILQTYLEDIIEVDVDKDAFSSLRGYDMKTAEKRRRSTCLSCCLLVQLQPSSHARTNRKEHYQR